MAKRKKTSESPDTHSTKETPPAPRKSPEWPETVPILTEEFISPGNWSNGNRFALLEWLERTFDPDAWGEYRNPMYGEAWAKLREVLLENVEGDTTGMGMLDLEALFDASRLADIWKETMCRLGYDL